ncbi:nitrilase-related carbon-nitrogen hydrolase [Bdellovibrionota bacterium FG-1]
MTKVKVGVIQCSNALSKGSIEEIKTAMIEKHLKLIAQAAEKGVQILGLQEIFNGPYFCATEDKEWYAAAEGVPDGPTVKIIQQQAKKYNMVIVAPVYEKEQRGVYYNTAPVIDADGSYLGKYRKIHIPQGSSFCEKYYFKPGNLGFPVFKTKYATIGAYICYDRHFPEGARALALRGAEIIFNPSATIKSTSQYMWKIEQPGLACANGVYVATINRHGWEEPWRHGEFYGTSYIVDPKGRIIAEGSEDRDEVVVAECDLDLIDEVRHNYQFFRDRRPDAYGDLVDPKF